MAKLTESFRYNLTRLATFSGRESRGQFWPYAIALFLGAMALSYLAFIPAMVDMLTRLGRFVEENPGRSLIEPQQGKPPGTLPQELMPDMTSYLQISILINALFVLLIAAAAVRRLHDRDRSGLWALLPLPFWMAAWAMSLSMDPGAMFSPTPEDARLYQLSMLNSLPVWGMLIWLIVLLAGEGTKGENRYGPDSAG